MGVAHRIAPWLLLSMILRQTPAFAQPIDDATRGAVRDIAYAAAEAYSAGNYALASEKFEKAYHIVPTPTLALWSARALVKLGKYVEAFERYQRATLIEASGDGAAIQKQAQSDATLELLELKPRIPSLIIDLEGVSKVEVKVTVDGARLAPELIAEAVPVNPGLHQLALERGGERAIWAVSLSDGERRHAVLSFAPRARDGVRPGGLPTAGAGETLPAESADSGGGSAPTGTESPIRMLGWIATGAGGASLLVGGVTYGLALGKRNALDCKDDRCSPAQQSDVDAYNSTRTVSTVAFVAGAVLATTGVTLLLTTPRSKALPSTSIWMSPNAVGIVGRF